MTKISLTGQNSILAFDNENALLYFDILTRKTTKLNFEVFTTNVLTSKWYKNHLNPMLVSQDIVKIPQSVKVRKLPSFYS